MVSSQPLGLSPRAWLGLAAILLFFVVRYLWVLDISWINDDFLFLERARVSTFFHNLSFDDALGNAWRPLSRNVYFWLARRAFGTVPYGFHVVSLVVAAVGVALFFFVLRRVFSEVRRDKASADGPALLGALLFAAHPAAATPVAWASGMQDLMCVAFALGAVFAYLHGRRVLYPVLFALAMLSKEVAAGLPIVLFAYEVACRRTGWRDAALRQIPVLALLAAWAAANPWLPWGARGSVVFSPVPGTPTLLGQGSPGAPVIALRSLLLAEPRIGYAWPFPVEQTVALILLAAIAAGLALTATWPRVRVGAVAIMGLVWAATGMAPLLAVASRFFYYAFYPSLGAVLVVTALLASLRLRIAASAIAAACVVVLLASSGVRHHPALLDGQAVRRASDYQHHFERDLLAMYPKLETGARCYFWNVPVNIGFQLVNGIALRVWYADTTLRGAWMNEYHPTPGHPEHFFGHDGNGGLFEIVRGEPDRWIEDPPPAYADCHNDLGVRLAAIGDMNGAVTEWRKTLRAEPRHARAAENLALAYLDAGRQDEGTALLERSVRVDSTNADAWYFLAHAKLRQGRYADAAASARRYLRMAPTPARAAEMREILETERLPVAQGG